MFATKNAKACAIACSLVLSLGLAACGESGTKAASTDTATEETTTVTETETAEVTDTTTEAAPVETTTTDAAPAETTTTAAPVDASAYIGEEQAIAAALADAGIDQASAVELECDLDLDDPVVHYDVDFKANGLDYEYDIDATTGAIISSHSEVED